MLAFHAADWILTSITPFDTLNTSNHSPQTENKKEEKKKNKNKNEKTVYTF